MPYLRALGRAFALAAFAFLSWVDVLVELITFALLCGGLVFFFGPTLEWAADRSAMARTLAARWCGVEVEAPYRPEPPEPVRERDGWYRDGNKLYKRAFWIRWQHRLTWAMEDPATGREFPWQLLNPLVTLLLPVAVLLGGPAALRGYGRWTRWMLGARPPASPPAELAAPAPRIAGPPVRHPRAFPGAARLLGVAAGRHRRRPAAGGAGRAVGPDSITDTLRREAGNWTGVRIGGRTCRRPACRCPARTGSTRSASSCTRSRSGRSSTRAGGGSWRPGHLARLHRERA